MEIITRQQAITLGLKKYFTGEPCKNGHIAERYLQSSTCEMCIRGSVVSAASPESDANRARRLLVQEERLAIEREKSDQRRQRIELAQAHAKLQERKLLLRPLLKRQDLAPLCIVLHWDDREYFKARMLALAMEIDPSIQMSDLLTNKLPVTRGLERDAYFFKTFKANHPELFDLQNSLGRDRDATGTDADDLHFLAVQARIHVEEAEHSRHLDEDNGDPPDRLDA